MYYNVHLSMEVQADNKKEVEERIENLMKYLMRVERQELGLTDWNFNVFETPTSFIRRRNNNNK